MLPKYVKIISKSGHETGFRLKDGEYWLDAGQWGVGCRVGQMFYDPMTFGQKPKLTAISNIDSVHGQILMPISEEEWYKLQGDYAPYRPASMNKSRKIIDDYGDGFDDDDFDIDENGECIAKGIDKSICKIIKDDELMYLLIR
jgi:hypothetical protein